MQLFQESLAIDLAKFARVASYYQGSRKSIIRVLAHFENNMPYDDTLASDFFNTTVIYEQNSFTDGPFETLKASGIELISNAQLRLKISEVYDDQDPRIETSEKRYVELIMNAGLNIYNTRFEEFWKGTEKDSAIIGVMIPTDYQSLRDDKEYLYFLKTQLNLMGWLAERQMHNATTNGSILKDLIENELEQMSK